MATSVIVLTSPDTLSVIVTVPARVPLVWVACVSVTLPLNEASVRVRPSKPPSNA